MRLPRETYQVQQTIETHLPHLSQPQLAGLVLWVCGAILAGSACQNAVASALSPWRSWNNLRQYLREWLYDGSDRARPCKTQLDVTLWLRTAAPVGAHLVGVRQAGSGHRSDSQGRPDHRHRHQRPLPWAAPFPWPGASTAPPRKAPGWTPPWNCSGNWPQAVPREMTVIVLCDRGISSPKLWKQIRAQGWHPCMRYRNNITFCADGWQTIARATLRFRSRHGLDRTGHRLRHPQGPTPLHPAGGLVRPARRNPGSSSPTCRRKQWE